MTNFWSRVIKLLSHYCYTLMNGHTYKSQTILCLASVYIFFNFQLTLHKSK